MHRHDEEREEDVPEADWIYGHMKSKLERYGFIESPSGEVMFIPSSMRNDRSRRALTPAVATQLRLQAGTEISENSLHVRNFDC